MRRATLVFLIVVAVILVACEPGIRLTVMNNTDVPICWYMSEDYPDTTDPELCVLVQPGEKIDFTVFCLSDYIEWVVLTLGVGGQEIYARSATCGEWEKAGATVVVDRRDGEYIVRDNLGEAR